MSLKKLAYFIENENRFSDGPEKIILIGLLENLSKKNLTKVYQETDITQSNCKCSIHSQKAVIEENDLYDSMNKSGMLSLKKIFTGSICSKCRKFISREVGGIYSICYACGGTMEKVKPLNGEIST